MKNYTLIEKALLLKKTPIFASLELDLLLPVADKLGATSAAAGELLFELGDQAYTLYLVTGGELEAYDETGKRLVALGEGDFFGDEALLSGEPRRYRTLCKTDCQLLTLSRTNLLAIIHEYPKAAVSFLEEYAKALPCRIRVRG